MDSILFTNNMIDIQENAHTYQLERDLMSEYIYSEQFRGINIYSSICKGKLSSLVR